MKHPLDWFKKWIDDIRTTNLVIVTGCGLAVLYVLWALVADTLGRPLKELTLNGVGLFISGMIAGGVVQFGLKRRTDDAYVAAKHGNPIPPRTTQSIRQPPGGEP